LLAGKTTHSTPSPLHLPPVAQRLTVDDSKMSASDPNSKIDLLEKPDAVKSKLKKAVCAPQEIEGNGVLSFVEYVLFPCAQLAGKPSFHVPRPEKWGGPVEYVSMDELKTAYADGSV